MGWRYTVQLQYNMFHYNVVFNKTLPMMVPKLYILLHVYSKYTHYNTLLHITQSISLDPKDSLIMRLTCNLHGLVNLMRNIIVSAFCLCKNKYPDQLCSNCT